MADLPKKAHIIGICGVATSAIAIALSERGVAVTGSDKGFFPPVSTELDRHNISYYAGWHPEKMVEGGAPDAVMIGTASGSQNPETAKAAELDILRYSYPEMLGAYFVKSNSIVCSGTWGKTSSSALLSFILESAGLDPSYMFGGISLSHASSAKLADSQWSVLEGDEYKSSPTDLRAKFFHYKPTHLLLSAVSWDHADLYKTEADYFAAFSELLSGMPPRGMVAFCADNPGIFKVIESFEGLKIPYGRSRDDSSHDTVAPAFAYKDVRESASGIGFSISHDGTSYEIHSPLLGAFQAENITGCFAMAMSIGIEPAKIVEAISKFQGLKRRLEKRLDGALTPAGITVIDDIAHSPEKASSVLKTLRTIYPGTIFAVFEPNTGGRKKEALEKYAGAFSDADSVIIPRLTKLKVGTDIAEAPIEGPELAATIGASHSNAKYIEDDAELVAYLVSRTKKGDTIAFLGSHGFRGMIEETVKALSEKRPS